MSHVSKPVKAVELKNPFEEMLSDIALALNEWKEKNTPEAIKKDLFNRMDKAQQEILLKLLGFDSSSFGRGGWELDHCNGRSGNSAAGDWLKKQQAEAVKEWLSSVELPKIPKTAKETLIANFTNEFERQVHAGIRDMAGQAAEEYLAQLKESLTSTDVVEKYNTLLEMLQPPKEE